MIFLATFFPMPELDEEEVVHKFDLVHDVFRATVDIADLVGIILLCRGWQAREVLKSWWLD